MANLHYIVNNETQEMTHTKNVLAEIQTRDDYRLGRIRKPVKGFCCNFEKDEIVLFKKSNYDDKTCTIEIAMPQKYIEEEKQRGSFLRTWKTMCCVPLNCVEPCVSHSF